jgi:hypothetical protein
MNKGNPLASDSMRGGIFDQAHAVGPQVLEGLLEIIDFEANVMQARSSFSQKAGHAAVIGGGFDQFHLNRSRIQEGNQRLLVGYFLDARDLKAQDILPEAQRFLDVLDHNGDVFDAKDVGHVS